MCGLLKAETPPEIRSLAAGEHQAMQQEVNAALTADIFRHFTIRCHALKEKGGTGFLTDHELYTELLSVGMLPKVDKHAKSKGSKTQTRWRYATPSRR